jgi:hypothetical protein
MNLARAVADPLAARADGARQQAHRYLLGRQSPSGGFCSYRSDYLDEPNLFDTWHAVAAFCLLRLQGKPPPQREAIANFVCTQPPGRQPYALYYRVFTLHALGSTDPDQGVAETNVRALSLTVSDPAWHSNISGQMERLFLTLRLKTYFRLRFAAEGIARSIRGLERPSGGFGATPNLLDTRLALGILALCGQTASTTTAAFVARLAAPGYGFRLTVNSLSPSLETVCAGIECCHRLRLPVAYPLDTAAFILDCQTGDGGFARAPDALPDIRLTHLALQGLATLLEGVLPLRDHND